MPKEFAIPDYIRQEAVKIGLDPAIALAIADKESSFNPYAIGQKEVITDGQPERAVGTFQFLPSTARKHGFDETDPQLNIQHGVRYLKDLLDRHGDPYKALAEYGGVKNDTTYVPDALARIKQWQQREAQRTPSTGTTTGPATTGYTTPDYLKKPGAATTPPGLAERFWDQAKQGIYGVGSVLKGANDLAVTGLTQDPRTTAKAVGGALVGANRAATQAVTHPLDTVSAIFGERAQAVAQAAQRARQAFNAGNYGTAVGEAGRTLLEAKNVPLQVIGMGNRFAEAEQFGREEKIPEMLGATTDVAANTMGPEILGRLGMRIPLRFKPHLLPEEQAAVDLLERGGVNVDLATATNNPAARAIQRGAESTIGGGGVGMIAKVNRQQAISDLGHRLAGNVHPNIVTPGEAGIALRQGTGDAAEALGRHASTQYGIVERAANDPAHLQMVQTGTAPPPFYPPGQPRVPVIEPIQAPTDLRQIKAALTPIRDEIQQQMPLGQQQYSKGLLALNNVLALRDFEPMLVADKNLSALKAVARGADHPAFRGVEKGTAALAVDEVHTAVDHAVAQLGPQAQVALAQGRAATRAKYAIEDLFDAMNVEKVQAFDYATASGDRHVEAFTELARIAPQAIPQVGRAVLEKIFTHASGLEKGWSREAGAARMWETLGPETKQILFGNNARDLDRFFLGQKMLARSANPSGTTFAATSIGSAISLGTNPIWAMLVQGAAGGFAALANTRAGVRLLTQGARIPPGDTTRLAAWSAAVANQLHRVGALDQVATPPPKPGATGEINATVTGSSAAERARR